MLQIETTSHDFCAVFRYYAFAVSGHGNRERECVLLLTAETEFWNEGCLIGEMLHNLEEQRKRFYGEEEGRCKIIVKEAKERASADNGDSIHGD